MKFFLKLELVFLHTLALTVAIFQEFRFLHHHPEARVHLGISICLIKYFKYFLTFHGKPEYFSAGLDSLNLCILI